MVLELSRDTVFIPDKADFFLEIIDEGVVIDSMTLTLDFMAGSRKDYSKAFWGFGEAYIYPVGFPPVCKADHSIFVDSSSGIDRCCKAIGWQGLDSTAEARCFRDVTVNVVNPRLLVKGREVWRFEGDATGKRFDINIDPETIKGHQYLPCRRCRHHSGHD